MNGMTAKEYLETKKRMCDTYGAGCCGCPFDQNEMGLCDDCEEKCIDEAIAVVQKWGEEHPIKTLMDKFFEVFPDTPKYGNGAPKSICIRNLGYKDSFCGADSEYCLKCWSQPYIEKK